MPQSEKKWYLGIDESNHGRDREIFAGVISPYSEDIKVFPQTRLTDYPAIWGAMSKRDFRFCLVDRADYRRTGNLNLLADVCSSIVSSLPQVIKQSRPLEIYIDGELQPNQETKIQEQLAKKLGKRIEIPISIYQVPKTQSYKTNYLILLADAIAGYLFRYRTLEQLTNKKRIGRKRVELVNH